MPTTLRCCSEAQAIRARTTASRQGGYGDDRMSAQMPRRRPGLEALLAEDIAPFDVAQL